MEGREDGHLRGQLQRECSALLSDNPVGANEPGLQLPRCVGFEIDVPSGEKYVVTYGKRGATAMLINLPFVVGLC